MRIRGLAETSIVLLLLCAMPGFAAPQQSTVPPTTPQGQPSQAAPPGTQNDRQIPSTGSDRNSTPSRPSDTNVPGSGQPAAKQNFGNFAQKAANRSLAAVKLGELAQSNSESSNVRDLGKMMVDDHQDAIGKLSAMLENSGISVGNQLDAGNQAVYDRLAKLSGDAFDREFIAQVEHDLQEAISNYEVAKAGAEENWRNYAAEYLPKLQKELAKAESISKTHTTPQAAPVPNRPRRPTWAGISLNELEEEA